ncbi:AAA family ATPase [Flavobacterium aquidurense]|uniref:Adenylate kinase and related kinase-like protein n=1 Tax=Flavobacterium aquidurense TaxID=362413 RepID=A0A0Q0X500_9FLAO|nr:AAA family ATPase [Flavobacterium aquidurense]KQB43623.1 Adenylate kinase and related kinase-like protein [Flavobacterium aquidurense]
MNILIFGASGSGVTTTGKILAQKLNSDYFDSDDYFWKSSKIPFTERYDVEERNNRIKKDLLNSKSWILGGSVFEWGENVFPDFDLVVFLWLPADLRIERLKKREFERYGNIIHTEPERILKFKKFIEWAADYDKKSGIANRNFYAHKKWMKSLKYPILKIEGDLSIEERIHMILFKIKMIS